jgi:hypothetical protein
VTLRTRLYEQNRRSVVHIHDGFGKFVDYAGPVPDGLNLRLERTEALELLAVVQATLNAIARSQDLTVGAAILTGIKSKLIDALEAGS